MRANRTAVCKIGMTRRKPDIRIAEISPKLPFEVFLIGYFESDNAPGLESALHDFFEDRRLNGEWFRLKDEDILRAARFQTEWTKWQANA